MDKLALKAWFCILLLFSAGVAGAWQKPPPGEPMPCDQMVVHQMASQVAQDAHHGHLAPTADHHNQEAHDSGCVSLGLCCLGSCMAPIALQSKALQGSSHTHTTPASVQKALIQTPKDPHFRPPIALS